MNIWRAGIGRVLLVHGDGGLLWCLFWHGCLTLYITWVARSQLATGISATLSPHSEGWALLYLHMLRNRHTTTNLRGVTLPSVHWNC